MFDETFSYKDNKWRGNCNIAQLLKKTINCNITYLWKNVPKFFFYVVVHSLFLTNLILFLQILRQKNRILAILMIKLEGINWYHQVLWLFFLKTIIFRMLFYHISTL